ncbi:MAG: hypothetical protein ACOX2F_09840 [bacterium]
MKFASCRVIDGKFFVSIFSREYSKTTHESMVEVPIENSAEVFKDVDYVDFVIPGKEVLFFSRNYPPVKTSYIKKIIAQDIEAETPFKESDLIIDMKSFSGSGETNVFCAKKETVKEMIKAFDPMTKEKVRSIVPEEILLFKAPEKLEKAVFIGDDYSLFVSKSGQIVMNSGLIDLKKELKTCFNGEDPENELASWLSVAGDISSLSELSDIEVLIRKKIIAFMEKIFDFFAPFATNPSGKTGVFVNDLIVAGVSNLIAQIEHPIFFNSRPVVYEAHQSLKIVPAIVDSDSFVSFAAGEFAYKGGFSFLKKRIIIAVALYVVALVMLIAGMQVRKNYLDARIESGEEKAGKLMKEVIGKEMPSLRQALSIMDKTIKGETSLADKKAIYPYSALYIMEVIFPYFTFEESTIEVSEVAIKEEGKIRVTGLSDSLEDINKFTELLESDPLIDEINRGQINTRNDKSSFSISFNYANPKKEDTKAKKSKKKNEEGI